MYADTLTYTLKCPREFFLFLTMINSFYFLKNIFKAPNTVPIKTELLSFVNNFLILFQQQ